MREDSLDEFESLFEQASIPVLEVEKVVLKHVSVVLADHALDNSALDLAEYLRKRFGPDVAAHFPSSMDADVARKSAVAHGLRLMESGYSSWAELIGQVAIKRPDLVVIPATGAREHQQRDLDALIEGTDPPVLVIRAPIRDSHAVFSRILHSLTGNFQQTSNFSCSFSLVEPGGELLLLHAIGEAEITDVSAALQAAQHITDRDHDEVIAEMSKHGERFLKGVVAAMRSESLKVSYRLAIGDVGTIINAALDAGDYGMLVVGHHADGRSLVGADDYRLIHSVKPLPILAL